MAKPADIRLAVILPTRGMPFSQTIDEVLTELATAKVDYKLFWSHGRPVPAAYNVPTNLALRSKGFTHFWFVDDDMILPKGVLKKLIAADVHAIACDYPVTKGGVGACMYDGEGRAFFTGAGCLLIKREVLDSLPKPIWRSDIGWHIKFKRDHMVFTAGSQKADKVYGQQDVNLGLRLYALGLAIYVSPITCGQRRIKNWGNRDSNNGAFEVEEWRKFHPNSFLIAASPQKRAAKGSERLLMTIKTKDGMVQAQRDHALMLIRAGVAEQIGYARFENYDFDRMEIIKEGVAA